MYSQHHLGIFRTCACNPVFTILILEARPPAWSMAAEFAAVHYGFVASYSRSKSMPMTDKHPAVAPHLAAAASHEAVAKAHHAAAGAHTAGHGDDAKKSAVSAQTHSTAAHKLTADAHTASHK
jgi:hypothetical protein